MCHGCEPGATEQGLGLVGAIIMPHNIYLHSGLVLVSVMWITVLNGCGYLSVTI